jgi:hypothetical protein
VTLLCLRCKKAVERLDSGTLAEIFSPGAYYVAGERVVWCPNCRIVLCQMVETRIRDAGEVSRRYVKMKVRPKGEGI